MMNRAKIPSIPLTTDSMRSEDPLFKRARAPDPFVASAQTSTNPFLDEVPVTVPRLLDFLDREDRPLSEVADATSDVALEIAISWGASVLSVSHLSPPRSFVIGDRGG